MHLVHMVFGAKYNLVVLLTAKFDEKFAMLIPSVSIRGGLHPPPHAFLLAVGFKLRLPLKMLFRRAHGSWQWLTGAHEHLCSIH